MLFSLYTVLLVIDTEGAFATDLAPLCVSLWSSFLSSSSLLSINTRRPCLAWLCPCVC